MENIKEKRSYEKEKYKTDPSGVRFNIEQLRIAMMRSKKKTKQQLVDFLLDNYVKGENPVMERNYSNTPAELAKLPNYPVNQIIPQQPKVSQYDAYFLEIKGAKSLEEIPVIVKVIKEDTDLVKWQQEKLEKFAIEHSKTFDF